MKIPVRHETAKARIMAPSMLLRFEGRGQVVRRTACHGLRPVEYDKALVRASGNRLTDRIPKPSLISLPPPGTDRTYGSTCHQHVVPILSPTRGSNFVTNTWFQFLGIHKYFSGS